VLERPNIGFVTTVNSYVHASAKALNENNLILNAVGFGGPYTGKIGDDGRLLIKVLMS
jgi:hypothetical protein